MTKLTFHPLGNADTTLIELANDEKVLFDYADRKDPDEPSDLRCDLPAELRKILERDERDAFDVVAFTHLDKDHYQGASQFFHLDHAQKYQGDDRIKIKTLWVPAAVITETSLEEDEARVLQREARHRLREGYGVRVFSRPQRLADWLKKNNLSVDDRAHLITDAGETVPGYSKPDAGVEFFVHSPFAKRLDDDTLEDRNEDSLVVQATFLVGGTETKVLLTADTPFEMLQEIVAISKQQGNADRLEWDVAKLPHHFHSGVGKPWASGPSSNSDGRRWSCAASSSGLRPARPARRSPAAPCLRYCRRHSLTVCRATFSRLAVSD